MRAGSLPSVNFQRYSLICWSLGDAEIQLPKSDRTSVTGTHCSLADLTVGGRFVAINKASPTPNRVQCVSVKAAGILWHVVTVSLRPKEKLL